MYFAAAAIIVAAIGAYVFARKAGLIGGRPVVRLTPQYTDFKLIEKVRHAPP
jgi:hypothetical protein